MALYNRVTESSLNQDMYTITNAAEKPCDAFLGMRMKSSERDTMFSESSHTNIYIELTYFSVFYFPVFTTFLAVNSFNFFSFGFWIDVVYSLEHGETRRVITLYSLHSLSFVYCKPEK